MRTARYYSAPIGAPGCPANAETRCGPRVCATGTPARHTSRAPNTRRTRRTIYLALPGTRVGKANNPCGPKQGTREAQLRASEG